MQLFPQALPFLQILQHERGSAMMRGSGIGVGGTTIVTQVGVGTMTGVGAGAGVGARTTMRAYTRSPNNCARSSFICQ